MTFGSSSTPDDIQRQRDAIPPLKVNKMNLISDALKIELKELINEAVSYTHLTLPTNREV